MAARASSERMGRPVVGVLDLVGGPDPVAGGTDPGGPRPDDALTKALAALRMAATLVELRRRLTGFEVRPYTLGAAADTELVDDAARSLAGWSPASAAALAGQVDAVVVLPAVAESTATESVVAGSVVADLGEVGVPAWPMAVDPDHPDPLVLAGRLIDAAGLDRRREYLAVTGRVPADRPYVLCLPASAADGDLEERAGAGRAVVRPEGPLLAVDLMGLVASAEAVVSSCPPVQSLALGLGRPAVAGTRDLDSTGAPACDPVKYAERRRATISLGDRAFDGLYSHLQEAVGSRRPSSLEERLASLEGRLVSLEAVNAGLRLSLARERSVMADEVRRLRGVAGGAGASWSEFNADRIARDLAAAQVHLGRLQAEIDAIYATRAMRALAPVRRLYGMARRIIPRPS